MGSVGGKTSSGLFTRPPMGPAGWAGWTEAAKDATRGAIQKSLDEAILVGAGPGAGPHALAKPRAPGTAAGLGRSMLGKPAMGDGSVRPGGVTVEKGALRTRYVFERDMELALARAGVPSAVAAAFAKAAWATLRKWGEDFSLREPSHKGGPISLSRGSRGAPPAASIAAELRGHLGPNASGPEAARAIQVFAEWLSQSFQQWVARATLDPAPGGKVFGGAKF